MKGTEMTQDEIRELIEAARPFSEPEPRVDWVCHGGDLKQWATCARCSRVFRLRAAIEAAEASLTP